jgi:hypothetical protein
MKIVRQGRYVQTRNVYLRRVTNIPCRIGGARNILARILDVLIRSAKTPHQQRNVRTSSRQEKQTVTVRVSILRSRIVILIRANAKNATWSNIVLLFGLAGTTHVGNVSMMTIVIMLDREDRTNAHKNRTGAA